MTRPGSNVQLSLEDTAMGARANKTLGVLRTAAAGLIALGLGACDQTPSAERISKTIDRSVDQASRQFDDAGKVVERKLDQAGRAIDDMTLTTKVKSALITEPGLKSGDIKVEAANGVVVLQGTTDTAEHRQRAAQVASNVEGVRAVRNEIVVRGT
jgi:osmotically-inducible protein OsmY